MPHPAERLPARITPLGDGFTVRRALPLGRRRTVGAWCFLDHVGPVPAGPSAGMHVGAHPHIGLQTFTWMIEGELIHRDSLGNDLVIRPGQVNLMTAGQGIAHTEDAVREGQALHAAQLWIALPESRRHGPPAFEHHAVLPVADRDGWHLTVLAGSALGLRSPAQVHTPLVGLDLCCTGAARTTLPVEARFEHAVMALSGTATVEGEPVEPGELLVFGTGVSGLDVATDAPARLLLIGGEPFAEPVLMWWNFVARTQDEIEAAIRDWNQGDARFGTVVPGSLAPRTPAPILAGRRLRA